MKLVMAKSKHRRKGKIRPPPHPLKAVRKPPGRAYQDLVATMAKAFDSTADVQAGKWVEGPDGRLDMDVSIEGQINGRAVRVVIECKDFDLRKTGPVGRPFVDALDSKRHDLGVDAAFICSNSGFTSDALSKARRKGIGMISVLASGDERVKAVIEKEIYFRKLTVGQITFMHNGPDAGSFHDIKHHDLTYQGRSVHAWLQRKGVVVIALNPQMLSGRATASFHFKEPTELQFRSQTVILDSIGISFPLETRWFSQRVRLNASLAMFDYLRQRVRFPSGQNQYLLENVNFDTGTPLPSAPEIENIGENLLVGEIDIGLVFMEGEGVGIIMDKETEMPNLEEIIIPEDLNLKIPN
jgi:hypothetical protein